MVKSNLSGSISRYGFGLGVGMLFAVVSAPLGTAIAEQPSTQQSFFQHPPVLVRANISQPAVYTPSTYEFTLRVPSNAGSPL